MKTEECRRGKERRDRKGSCENGKGRESHAFEFVNLTAVYRERCESVGMSRCLLI